MRFTRDSTDQRWVERISLRDVDEIEEHAAEAKDWIPRNTVCLCLERHGARSDFVETIIDRACFVDVRKRNEDGDVAVRAKR